ncbi:MAG: glutamate synthase large subunit [Alphaproteobacteria bacterium]|nr:glutamate synthase large subunit [Alphaproteobacteria bacterium]
MTKENQPIEAHSVESGADFHAAYAANRAKLIENHAYNPADEHDACGVGFVASLNGEARRDVVLAGIEALKAIWHRGAVDADGKTGDGAGIHIEIPQDFFRAHVAHRGIEMDEGRLGVGMVFLPRTDLSAQERCRCIVEQEILEFGYAIYGWRQVPVNIDVIGEKANTNRPEIEQIVIRNVKGADEESFERDLYLIRRRIEKRTATEGSFYICSLSCRSVIYKGMFLAEQVTDFYPDLLDDRFVSRFAVYHQRYSTNTFPTWRLAQPFRILAHNGEINTISGNENWMRSHEARIDHPVFAGRIEDLKPVIEPGSSDSAALDSVFELLCQAGRDLPMVKTMMIPEAWGQQADMPQAHRDLYAYVNAVMEPWDGPAAVAGVFGDWIIGGMDRNGLRPMRFTVSGDDLLIAGSETGMVKVKESTVVEKGRLDPGEMIAVNLAEGKVYHHGEMKDLLAGRQDFAKWTGSSTKLDALIKGERTVSKMPREDLRRRQLAYGWTMEELELILQPMVDDAKEAIGSMGDDTPVAPLSKRYRGLHHFFRQNFSQVTNPPIDSLRERRVMTLKTRLGNLGNILDEDEDQCQHLLLESPVVSNAEFDAMRRYMREEESRDGDTCADIDCTFAVHDGSGGETLREAMKRIERQAEEAVREGALHIVLSDERAGDDRVAVPMILATGVVHSHLVRQNLRTFTSINVRAGEALDVHYFAVLIGVGATTVNAYIAEESILDRHARGLFGDRPVEECVARFKKAIGDGLLKIMSKMGISVISSYRGGYNFEAIGLSRALVSELFPSMQSRLSGIGLSAIERKTRDQHALAHEGADVVPLPVGGLYRFRRNGEEHAFEGTLIHMLQRACDTDSYATFKKYSDGVRRQPVINLRDLMDFNPKDEAIPADEVDSITNIRRRLVAPGISLGALSPEAHETLSIAMNRIGAKSDSGEGGEDPARYRPRPNGDNPSSAIKQVASGRFGVTAEYLNNCRELEIKVAQGAKPGEGGQLPGMKVTGLIAKLRHSTPGVTLISPPPHHDIYSIEDLAQLIYDLKQINPDAKVCVKLVARTGIGTIAAGVAKAKADVILISGHSGGTGASPQTSIKYAGVPWEMGLSEVNQVLTLNRLRHNVRLRVDGGIKTGRDVVIAAMLGAEEFGIGTASLVAMGCIMVRQCHSNTCPVGVCTQDEALRDKFTGTPEKVMNLFSFVAEEVRDILASLGMKSLEDVIGRTDLLQQVRSGTDHGDSLDLNPLLVRADSGEYPRYCTREDRNPVPDTLDAQMVEDAKPLLEDGEKMQLTYNVANTMRAVGTRLSSHIVRKYGMTGLQPGHMTVRLRGSAGQSLGAFAVQGLKLEVFGDANDYVAKGLSGGTVIVRPMTASPLVSQDNTIVGNTVLYGATAGKLFAAGQAGERFAVRNSGAEAVVEGCGSNGCEYMTGGMVGILGPVGDNFAAGMTGGMAFVYDADGSFERRVNADTVLWQRIETEYWEEVAKRLIREHAETTQSKFAQRLLIDWQLECGKVWQVVPKEMIDKLPQPIGYPRDQAGTGDD